MSDPADRLRDIANGFQHAKILLAGAQLRVFDHVRGGGRTARALASWLHLDPRGTEILLDALTAIGVLRKLGDVYVNVPELEPLLVEDGATHTVASLRHSNRLFRHWAFLEERLLDQPFPAPIDPPGAEMADDEHESFIRAMYAVSHRAVSAVVDCVPLDSVRTVADLGGGPGHYLAEFLRRSPTLDGYLVDFPATLEIARRVQRDNPDWPRAHLVAWNLYADEAPAGLPALDVAFLSQVVHSASPDENRALFRRLVARVSPGGCLVVHERVVDPDRTTPVEAAVFAVNMLVMTREGRAYTEAEIVGWGREAGFDAFDSVRLSGRSHVVTLRRPRT